MNEKVVSGIILSSMPVGEYDRRIVILTKELGRISAFVRGARRSKSLLLGSSLEFISATFYLYRGRDSYSVKDIDVNNYFDRFRKDLEKSYYGYYFLELVNYYTRENNDESLSLYLLYRTLQALERSIQPNSLIRAVFEFKLLVIQGEYPSLDRYMDSQDKVEELPTYKFSVSKNGLVQGAGIPILKDTVYTMIYIINSSWDNLFSFKLNDKISKEFIKIVNMYFKKQVDYKFKSLASLEWVGSMNKFLVSSIKSRDKDKGEIFTDGFN